MRRMGFASLLAAVMAAAIAASAGAGGPGTPITEGAKTKNGPWKQNIFSKGTRPRSLYMRVTSTHNADQTATLIEEVVGSGAEDFRFKWFRGKTDISHDVQTSGFEFPLREGSKRKFKIRAKPRVDNPRPACMYANVTVDVPSTGDNGPFFAFRQRGSCVP